MKYSSKKWFTLIEIIVATSILTIAVFWVFKLIWENNKILSTSQNVKNSYLLLQPFTACINSLWQSASVNISEDVYMDLWMNKNLCQLSSTPVELNLNWWMYQLIATKLQEDTDWILWNLRVSSDISEDINVEYLQK